MAAPLGAVKIGRSGAGKGRRPPFAWVLVVAALGLGLLASGGEARDLGSRLGNKEPGGSGPAGRPAAPLAPATGAPPVAEVVPGEAAVLPLSGPLAADGAGRLLLLVPAGDGYAVLGSTRGGSGEAAASFETVYRRKAATATGLAVGTDGTFCIGLHGGVDCIDPRGRIHHVRHDLFSHTVAVALAADGHLWALRSTAEGITGLELVRAAPGLERIQRVLTLRSSVRGFPGNGLAAGPDGSVYVPVIENNVHRVLRVEPSGRFTRLGDFWRLGGGIAVAATGAVLVPGVKRPQSVHEQRSPQDVVYAHGADGSSGFAARFPLVPGGASFTGHVALGGDGTLYVIRRQPVRLQGEPPAERPVLWRVPLGRGGGGPGGRIIDFRIPFIEALTDPRTREIDYAGPLLVARGFPLLITGLNFEGKEGERRVLIGGKPAPVEAWSEERIAVRIPADASGGPTGVRVAIDHVLSDPESIEVKTPDVPGWFQIGSPGMQAALRGNLGIVAYNARIVIEGVTDRGLRLERDEAMETPGLFHIRLPNGEYRVRYSAAYVYTETWYGRGSHYVGSAHIPVRVPDQFLTFRITDEHPITVWMPDMLGLD